MNIYLNFFLMIFIASVAATALGMLWYSPILFGKKWMSYMGITEKPEMNSSVWKSYAMSFGTTILMAFMLAVFTGTLGQQVLIANLEIAGAIWLGFVATTNASEYIFAVEKKPFGLYLINQGYALASLLVIATVFTYWVA